MGRSGELRSLNDSYIRDLLQDEHYDVREDGTIWTLKTQYGYVGKEWRKAGRFETNGYVQILYKGKRLLAHRIVYQKFNGSLKNDLLVDHINGIRHDNRAENLRLATNRTNAYYRQRRLEERETKREEKQLSRQEEREAQDGSGVLEAPASSGDSVEAMHDDSGADQG